MSKSKVQATKKTEALVNINSLNNADFDEITPEELLTKFDVDTQYQEMFDKLNESFLSYSDELELINIKREHIINLLKGIHKEYKKLHPNEMFNDDFDDETDSMSDYDMNDDVEEEEPIKPAPKTVKKSPPVESEPEVVKPTKPVKKPVAKKTEAKTTTKAVPKPKAPAKKPAK